MKAKHLTNARLALCILAFTLLVSCSKSDTSPNMEANKDLMSIMDDYYLWYDKMPSVKYENYYSPNELLEALRYRELDKWSYITTRQEIEAYYDDAQFIGFGIGMAFDQNGKLWITFIFDDSPLRKHGVDRGWRIDALNGVKPTPSNVNDLFGPSNVGVTVDFAMINPDGETVRFSASKRAVTMNTVLLDTVYSAGQGKVAYIVLKGFIGKTNQELDQAFGNFLSQGVSDLIVDLRYNTGGLVDAASYLSDLMAGYTANNQILGTYVHNEKQSKLNKPIYIKKRANSLNISRAVFITSGQSASASELAINGLFPYLDLTLVGSKTYGKPVGMYVFTSDSYDWAFIPICFKILNANNEGDYYNGIPVDINQIDGINYPFGNLDEPCLNSAIAFIQGLAPKYGMPSANERLEYPIQKGLYGEIGAW